MRCRVFQAGVFPRLLGERYAFYIEEGEEDAVWRGCCKFREDGCHVRLPFCDRGGGYDLAADGAKRIAKCDGEAHGVWVTIVEGGHAPQAQFIVCEVGYCVRLIEVVDRNAKITGMIVGTRVAGEVGCECRRGVRWRDHYQTRRADHRCGRHCRTRAVRADDAEYLRVGDDLLCAHASAFRSTPARLLARRVRPRDRGFMPKSCNGQFNSVPRRHTERCRDGMCEQ